MENIVKNETARTAEGQIPATETTPNSPTPTAKTTARATAKSTVKSTTTDTGSTATGSTANATGSTATGTAPTTTARTTPARTTTTGSTANATGTTANATGSNANTTGSNATPIVPTGEIPPTTPTKRRNIFQCIFGTKKGWAGVIIVGLAGIMSVVGLTHFHKQDNYKTALGNVAEARYYMKTAEADGVAKVQLYSGTREDPYVQDGIANTNKAFTVVSVEPTNDLLAKMVEIPAEVTIDGVVTQITLTKNPYGTNFAFDLGKLVENTSVVSVALKIDDTTAPTVFQLTNVMPDNAISWEQALRIATETINAEIDTTKNLETYIKVICDNRTVDTPYWYVTFATEDGKTLFVIIDPTGKVVGKSK